MHGVEAQNKIAIRAMLVSCVTVAYEEHSVLLFQVDHRILKNLSADNFFPLLCRFIWNMWGNAVASNGNSSVKIVFHSIFLCEYCDSKFYNVSCREKAT